MEWDDATLKALAHDFGASEEVIARRLLLNGLASEAFYRRKRSEYASRADKESPDTTRDFKRNMPQEAVSNLGSFARLVLDGYHAGLFNLSEVSRHLGIRAKKVVKIDNLVR